MTQCTCSVFTHVCQNLALTLPNIWMKLTLWSYCLYFVSVSELNVLCLLRQIARQCHALLLVWCAVVLVSCCIRPRSAALKMNKWWTKHRSCLCASLSPWTTCTLTLQSNLCSCHSQFLCLKNIRTFLAACSEVFGMRKSELFEAFDLFDVRDFGKVRRRLLTRAERVHRLRQPAPAVDWLTWICQILLCASSCLLS